MTVIVTSNFDDDLINHFPIINLWDILDAKGKLIESGFCFSIEHVGYRNV